MTQIQTHDVFIQSTKNNEVVCLSLSLFVGFFVNHITFFFLFYSRNLCHSAICLNGELHTSFQ